MASKFESFLKERDIKYDREHKLAFQDFAKAIGMVERANGPEGFGYHHNKTYDGPHSFEEKLGRSPCIPVNFGLPHLPALGH